MSQKKNDIIFNAADIEKYHKGLMSAKERHALEKAALDDPFLAEALDGFSAVPVNVNEDITELKRRLAGRTEKSKLIRVPVSFSLWKIAAMILLIAGAGLLIYELGFTNKDTEIAQADKNAPANVETAGQNKTVADSLTTSTFDSSSKDMAVERVEKNQLYKKNEPSPTLVSPNETTANVSVESNAVKEDPAKGLIEPTAPPVGLPPANANDKTDQTKRSLRNDNAVEKNAVADNSFVTSEKKLSVKRKADADSDGVSDRLDGNTLPKPAAKNAGPINQGFAQNKAANVFRGRVTDVHNNALPFSNITNLEDQVGTYSDARGYFNLTSPDSVLNVQVRSLGFESHNIQLLNNVPENKVFLEEDRSVSATILDTVKRNTNRVRNHTMVLEEPEPVDGWSNYDLYLVNNLKVPESFRGKRTGGEVELSFDVDKNGEPFNFTVKKSLCESCDKEAIRLIKDGPKWKRKIKKGKATVTISF